MPTQHTLPARTRWLAGLGVIALLCGAILTAQASPGSAVAEGLPTWEDVQKAKRNEKAAAEKVVEIKGLLAASAVELERLQGLSAEAMDRAQAAEQELQVAAAKSDLLDQQAEQSRKEADEATKQAASLVSQMYRSGGVDRSVELFLQTDGDTADALLERLASMEKATERNTTISEQAEQATNTAKSLGEQAEVARAERKKLKKKADDEYAAAEQAAATQATLLMEQQNTQELLEAQLAALEDKTTTTVDGYKERLRKEEEERKRLEEEARWRQQQRWRRRRWERRRRFRWQQRLAAPAQRRLDLDLLLGLLRAHRCRHRRGLRHRDHGREVGHGRLRRLGRQLRQLHLDHPRRRLRDPLRASEPLRRQLRRLGREGPDHRLRRHHRQ